MNYSQFFSLFALLLIHLNLGAQVTGSFASPEKHTQPSLQTVGIGGEKLLASNSRSDSINILKYTISLNITDFTTKTIGGNTLVKFTPRVNGISTIALDLLKLIVDSVKNKTSALTYSYNDTLLKVNLGVSLNPADTASIIIYYHGTPSGDASGWGGFYFQSNIAYNLGVGFAANPHGYGRVWYPCFDNFVERASYEFDITTNNGKISFCNGLLAKDTSDSNGNRTRTWKLDQEIPSYLACVAVGAYTQIQKTFTGVNGPVPVLLAALPVDTANVRKSFVNLISAFNTFEKKYYPYSWPKIGYSMVPFSSGAMEHATNITYPQLYTNGTTGYQTIMAHEFAHHWWGDLVTCETAEDMWINEGMAVYSERIFLENLSGPAAYKSAVRTDHETVLHYAHIDDSGYRAVSGVPHDYTYGTTVYHKGASVVHNMRTYMGDSAFFKGLRSILNKYKFKNLNSYQYRDELLASTGIDMTDFFTDWIFKPGFPHFSVDSFEVVPNGINYDVTVHLKQKLTGTTSYYTNVPLEITFKDSAWTEIIKQVNVTGALSTFQFTIQIHPAFVGLNLGEKINEAVAPDLKVLKATGNIAFSNARFTVKVNAVSDSAFIFVEHNYTAPDPIKTALTTYRLSPNHYWKVTGLLRKKFNAGAIVNYDGRLATGGIGYLDDKLITTVEDSLVLLYRKNAADDWILFPYYKKNMGSNKKDSYGVITIDSLWMGEYVFAMKDVALGFSSLNYIDPVQVHISPNPAHDQINLEIKNTSGDFALVELIDMLGKKVFSKKISVSNGQLSATISVEGFVKGIYLLRADMGSSTVTRKVIVE